MGNKQLAMGNNKISHNWSVLFANCQLPIGFRLQNKNQMKHVLTIACLLLLTSTVFPNYQKVKITDVKSM
jgi:hypothetical protein